jgi:ABC-2 type transport system permease protein
VWSVSPGLPAELRRTWYFAFHQVGDESVAEQLRAQPAGLERDTACAFGLV